MTTQQTVAPTTNGPHPVRRVPAAPSPPGPVGRPDSRPEAPQSRPASEGQPQTAFARMRQAASPAAWAGMAFGFVPLSSLLGLGFAIPAIGTVWEANLWADLVFAFGTAGTAFLAFALMASRSKGARIASVPAALLLTWLTYAVAATLMAPGFIFLSGGSESLPTSYGQDQNGFLGLPWDMGAFAAMAVLVPAVGALGIAAVGCGAPLLAHLLLRKVRAAEAPSAGAWSPTPLRAPAAVAGLVSAAPKAAKANGHSLHDVDPHLWIQKEGVATTADIPLPELLIDEVIGQEEAVEVAKKAARQRRHLLLLGDPGTGKSMIAKAMAQILPPAHLDDVLLYANPKDENMPKVKVLPGGQGRHEANEAIRKAKRVGLAFRSFEWVVSIALVVGGIWGYFTFGGTGGLMLIALCMITAIFFIFVARQLRGKPLRMVPNLLIERPSAAVPAPYVDATGSHHGALLGDVRHDPFQSGGLQTPTHLRVEPGAIHRAHKGLLFIDEINVLRLDSQQALLTAMQEKRYAITGQSERSSGAMARTEPVPCDFVLVAAGNMDVIAPTNSQYQGLHPALRSRIRGYGYEVYVKSVMDDTDENRRRLVRFVAQEVRRDGSIPHFAGGAVAEVLREAQRRSGHSGKLTLRLRELGGLVRTAGDIARDAGADEVTVDHVLQAKRISMSLEYQVTRRGIEVATAKEALTVGGEKVGTAVGCAFMGTGETGEPAGIVVPVEADATASANRQKGSLFLGGGLEKDAALSDTVGAVLKRFRGADMAGLDLHVQALLQQSGADVQALGAAAAVACISALEGVPVRQDTVVLGAVAVSGRLRAVEGVTQMIEGAADLGYTHAVVPEANRSDILLEHAYKDRIEVHLVPDLAGALGHALSGPKRTQLQAALRRTTSHAQPAARTKAKA